MKRTIILLLSALILSATAAVAQIAINTDGSAADASAILDLKSSDKGILIPRVTLNDASSADPVTNPPTGLLIYNVDGTATYAVAVGRGAQATNNYTVSLGANSDATSIGSIALGKDAQATTQNYACALGYNADASGLHSVAIGYNSIVTGDDEIVIGNSAILNIGGYQNWSNLSDARFKINVNEEVPGLVFIQKLRPVTYQVDIEELNRHLMAPRYDGSISKANSIIHTGFIAQEVEQAAKELNYDFNGIKYPGNENDHYGIRYATFVVPLVKAVQEQQTIIDDLKHNETVLLQEIENIKEIIKQLQNSADVRN